MSSERQIDSVRTSEEQSNGWNDPPQFAYNQLSQNTTPKRILKKHVPYPQFLPKTYEPCKVLPPLAADFLLPTSLVVAPTSQDIGKNLDIMPLGNDKSVPPICPAIPLQTDVSTVVPASQTVSTKEETDPAEEEMKILVTDIFERLLHKCSEGMQKKNLQDVRRRLDLLFSCWKEEKLSYSVKKHLFNLANAILDGKYDVADSIHLSLMMDHFKEVRMWMVGMKHLIHEAKEKNISIQKEETENSEEIIDDSCNNSL